MIKKRRVYEVAKDLGMDNVTLIKKLKIMGVRVDNIFNAIDEEIIQKVIDSKDLLESAVPVKPVEKVSDISVTPTIKEFTDNRNITVDTAAKLISNKYGVDEEEVLDGNHVEKIEHKSSAPKYKPGEYKGSHNNHQKPKHNPSKNNNDPNKIPLQLKEVISRLDSAIRGLRCVEADISEVGRNVKVLNDKVNNLEYLVKKFLPDNVIIDPEFDRLCKEGRAKALEDHCNNIIKQNRNNNNNGNYNP